MAVHADPDQPLRLLQVIARLNPHHGGPIDGARQLAAIWRAQGHEVDFLTLDAPGADYLDEADAAHALGRPRPTGQHGRREPFLHRFGYSRDFNTWLKRNHSRYDAVIVHALWNYATLAARQVLVNGPTPYFVFPHGVLDPWFKTSRLKHIAKSIIWPISEGRLLNRANAVLFTTEEERRLAEGFYWPYDVRSEVVGFGSSDVPCHPERQVAAFRAAVPMLKDRPFLLFVGRIHRVKACDLLIEAFASVADDHPTLDLVMAGPDQSGWRAELEMLVRARGIEGRVHWTGMIEGDVKWGAYRCAEAFALTSHTENFGVVVAEALACGRPVLLSDKVKLWREVVDCGAGMVETNTKQGACRLLRRFLALSPGERKAMAERARGCFVANFRMETTASRIIDVIRRRGNLP